MKERLPIRAGRLKNLLILSLMLVTHLTIGQVVNIGSSPSTIELSVEAGSTADQTFTLNNSGNATLEWALENMLIGEEATFTKIDFADWTLEENQDRITDQIWITRANQRGIFNINSETDFNGSASPEGTEWSYGNSIDLSPTDYMSWRNAVSGNPPGMVGEVISMHAIAEDRYFDIEFTSWSEDASGGGFSYIRSEVFKVASLSSNNGVVASGASSDVTLTVDAQDLAVGTYSFKMVIASNATSIPELIIPVELTVTGGSAEIDVTSSLAFSNTFVGGNSVESLTIVNDGAAPLIISDISADNSVFTTSVNSLTVPAYSSEDIEVIFTPSSNQSYTGILTLSSNDASSPTEISLSGNGNLSPIIGLSITSFEETLNYGNSVTSTLTIENTGASALNWSARLVVPNSTVSFQKQDYAEPSEPANQDKITDNVWITRANNQGIFNINSETDFNGSVSPEGTEWSYGNSIDLSPTDYMSWRNAVSGNPPGMVGQVISMRTMDDNRYFDIEFSRWTEGGNGGGFAYTRTEVPGWVTLSEYDGMILPASSSDITLDFDANRFKGEYEAQLIISSNDPLQSEIVIPVTITIDGTPEILIPVTTYDFGNVYVGSSSIAAQVEVTNNGTADLTVADVVSDNAAFTVSSTSAVIPGGGQSAFFEVHFTPSAAGEASATLTITSDDPVNSSMTVDLLGEGLVPPSISVEHNELIVDLDGSVYDETISIANTEGEDLEWKISGTGQGDIDETLVSLNDNFNLILDQLPGYYEFNYDGGSGDIGDGGNDIYDTGNELSTDLSGGIIDYSDNVIADGTGLFGDGTTYYTRHFSGLFVLAADLNGVSEFTIDGNIGADGSGNVTGPILEVERNGKTYQGFVKIVAQGGDPSIHHLIIIEKNTNVTQEYDVSAQDDYHKLMGLSESSRLYYLLFTRQDETAYSEAQLKTVMNTFLDITAGVPDYVTLSAESGTITSGNTDVISISIDPTAVPQGTSGTELKVISNDINSPEVIIPVTFVSTPKIVVSETEFSFGDVFQGYPEAQGFTVTNQGVSSLEVTSIVSDNDQFTIEPSSLSLGTGEEALVDITYSPSGDGAASGTITLTTNDPANETVEILVDGNGLTAPAAVVSPESISVSLFPGESTSETISIENTQGINLDWTLINTAASGSLENVLSNLNDGFSNITDIIPSRYDFTYDIAGGYAIESGGNNMFASGGGPGGNIILNTPNAQGPLAYSDNAIGPAEGLFGASGVNYFGEGSRIFTRHLPGLFVLAADINQHSTFGIGGEAGTTVSTDGVVLEVTLNGVAYQGFVKRIYGGTSPSINQLVIIEKDDNVTQDLSNTMFGSQSQLIDGLSETSRLYYLMYAGTAGAYINDTETETIMRNFLETILPVSNLSATSGSTVAGNTDEIDFTILADDYPTGITRFNLNVNSNDPEQPTISIPVTVSVGNLRVENIIDDVIINEGFGTEVIDISTTFRDADDDILTYDPASSREDVLLASVAGESLTLTEQGIGTSRISIAATDGVNTAFADFNVRVNALPVIVTPIEDQSYENGFGTAQFDLTPAFEDADADDELSYTVSLSGTGVVEAAIENGVLTLTEVGPGTVNVTISVTDGVGGSLDHTFEVFVNKIEQTITFNALDAVTYGVSAFELNATASSDLAVDFSSTDPAIASIDGTTVTILGAGTVTITASQNGDGTFNAATDVEQSLVINKAELTVTADNVNITAGDPVEGLTVSYEGFVNNDDAASLITEPVASTSATSGSAVGEYAIIVSGGESDNYSFLYVEGTLTILEVTAINKEKIANVAIYPNPASSQVNVILGIENTQVDIIDASGAVIKHIANYTSGESIDVSLLKSGVYIVRVQTDDAIANLRFIKQ